MKDVIKLLNAVQRCTAFSKVFTLNEFESGNAGFEPACELPIGAHERVERAEGARCEGAQPEVGIQRRFVNLTAA